VSGLNPFPAEYSNKHVLSVLEDVAKQLEFIKLVADKEIEEKLHN
jgi:hypothetical protein